MGVLKRVRVLALCMDVSVAEWVLSAVRDESKAVRFLPHQPGCTY